MAPVCHGGPGGQLQRNMSTGSWAEDVESGDEGGGKMKCGQAEHLLAAGCHMTKGTWWMRSRVDW